MILVISNQIMQYLLFIHMGLISSNPVSVVSCNKQKLGLIFQKLKGSIVYGVILHNYSL